MNSYSYTYTVPVYSYESVVTNYGDDDTNVSDSVSVVSRYDFNDSNDINANDVSLSFASTDSIVGLWGSDQ